MFGDIDFSLFSIKKRQIRDLLYVSIKPKELTIENYQDLLKLKERINVFENSQIRTMCFSGSDRDFDAPILPEFRDRAEQERREYQECIEKIRTAFERMEELTLPLWSSGKDFEYVSTYLEQDVFRTEYYAPIEYRERRILYDDAELSFFCRPDTDVYDFFKRL